ncbi:hypothetical protein TorRG33x02_338680, partial [Trema orientale]
KDYKKKYQISQRLSPGLELRLWRKSWFTRLGDDWRDTIRQRMWFARHCSRAEKTEHEIGSTMGGSGLRETN